MMNYFVGIVLCIAIVNAEAIPEALTLGPVQNFLYQKATETSKFLKSQQGLLQTNVPAFPNVLPQVPLKPDLQPTSSTTPVPKPKPVEPKAPNVLPQVPLKSDLKQTPSATPDVSPKGLTAPVPMSMVPPLPMPSEPNVVPQGLTTPLPNPKVAIPSLPLPAKSKPPVVPTIPSPEVDAAKARAISLYGKEPGFVSVTDRVMKTRDGQRFLYINIKGDGNCGFYAIGVDRARFVNAIEDLVNVQHDVFQDFFKGRQALVRDIDNIMLPDDKTAIEARVRTIAAKADNGGDITSALKLLTDFATEKTAYHTELFVDARNRLIANLQKLEDLSKVRSNSELGAQVGTLVALLTSAESIDSINVDDLTRQYTELVTSLTQAGVNVKQVQDAFKELITCKYGDVELFEKGKSRLINKIENLMTLSSYESFLSALKKELNADDLATKEKVLAGVRTIFSMNRGSATWFPGGLFAAIKDRLGVEYNIWSMDYSAGVIKLLSSSSDSRGVAAKGPSVRHVFFTGGHYDMLIPLAE